MLHTHQQLFPNTEEPFQIGPIKNNITKIFLRVCFSQGLRFEFYWTQITYKKKEHQLIIDYYIDGNLQKQQRGWKWICQKQ